MRGRCRRSLTGSDVKTRVPSPARWTSSDGRTLYALSIEAFPGFFANVYLVDLDGALLLIDTGSGMDSSNEDLERGLESLHTEFGVRVRWSDVDAVLVTHGHMDHFGGVAYVRERTDAPVGVHTLERRVLSHYEERVVLASQQVGVFLERCGLSEAARQRLLTMYSAPKTRYQSMPVDFVVDESEDLVLPLASGSQRSSIEVLHVPGHAPGLVCLRIDDILLTADHVLSRITPHQAPESITAHMGLSHYFDSLRKTEALDGIRIGLGGHEAPIEDVSARCRAIRQSHEQRLEEVFKACRRPRTLAEVSRAIFGELHGYNVLLGLEEAGAHVEHLHRQGALVAANVQELEQGNPVARYLAV